MIPHLIWLSLWGLLALIVMPINWIATVVMGQSPPPLHNFLAAYLIYNTHVTAYMHLIADPYPGFTSTHAYPVSVEIDGSVRQNRLSALLRWILTQSRHFRRPPRLRALVFCVRWLVCSARSRSDAARNARLRGVLPALPDPGERLRHARPTALSIARPEARDVRRAGVGSPSEPQTRGRPGLQMRRRRLESA